MRRVTFKAECPQSIIRVTITGQGEEEPIRELIFQASGEKFVMLEDGTYDVLIVAIGTPGTDCSLEVTTGGKMTKFKRTLPTADKVGEKNAGRAAADRTLTVTDTEKAKDK